MESNFHRDKSRQDAMPVDKRDRVHNWDRIQEFSKKHKPRRSGDWLALRKH